MPEEYFPDGTPIASWFYDLRVPALSELGTPYVLKDHGIRDDGTLQTEAIQALIDQASAEGGGVIIVPNGTWLSGALFFPGNVNLYIEKGGILKGSEHIRDYPLCTKRIEGIKGPSTDAIDIDACTDVLVKNCYMAVNDDAVALKGGKGPWADQDPDNGANERIIVEDCEYGFVHGCLTFGSESIHDRNIILRRIHVSEGYNLLWMKFRPDTPQCYEYVRMEDIRGKTANFLNINPWRQFFDLQGRSDLPVSCGRHVELRNCEFTCDTFFNVQNSEQYTLSEFTMENLNIKAADTRFEADFIQNLNCADITLEQKEEQEFPDAVTTL